MATKTNKKEVETKEVKTVETKVVETKEVKNSKKLNLVSIEDVTKMYQEAGIKCFNPNAKGNYRIMGSKKGSSLNVKPNKGYIIYTSDEDLQNLTLNKVDAKDLVIEKGANSQDKSRANIVACTETDTLKMLLKVYAMNVLNQIVKQEVAVVE